MQTNSSQPISADKEDSTYLKTIIDLATSHRETKELLKDELDRYRLNKKLISHIETLVRSSVPHYINAVQEGRFYKRLAVEFNLKKKFIEFIEFLNEDFHEEAAYYFAKEIDRNLGEQCQVEHYSIKDYLLKSIKPRLNPKLCKLDPYLETAISEEALKPFSVEIKLAFNSSVEIDEDLNNSSNLLQRAVSFIDIKMHQVFLSLVSEQSATFQLLAYDFFYRKQLENSYKIFSNISLEYASKPYRLAKFISLSPYLFRRK